MAQWSLVVNLRNRGSLGRRCRLLLISAALAGCSSSQSPAPDGAGGGGAGGSGGVNGGGMTSAAGTSAQAGTLGASGNSGVGGSTAGNAGSAGGPLGTAGASGAAGYAGAGGLGGAAGSGGQGGLAGGGAAGASGAGGGVYQPCPTTAGTACAVLPLGDSITEGCCTSPFGGYRIELFRQAVVNAKNLTFVGTLVNGPGSVANRTFPMHHEGHGGYTIAGGGQGAIAGTVTDAAISTSHPNIVLLMIGTNDINGNIDVANAPTRLGQLIDEITSDAPSALLVVATIIPIGAPNADQKVQTYNAAIPGLVNTRAAAGKHVVLLDNYAAFAANPNYQTALKADGLHPNSAGYVVLGQSFYGAIGALLPAGP